MTLLTLLLDTNSFSFPGWVRDAVSLLALALVLLQWFRREQREDGQTVPQRLKKVETRVADHDQLHTGQGQARERLADTLTATIDQVERTAEARHTQLKESIERRCADLEKKADEVPSLRERIAGMEAKLDRLPSMEAKLDRLHELLGRLTK